MVEPENRYDVVIAGAGVVGLTLALALRHELPRSCAIALVDRRRPQSDVTAGGDIRASALAAGTVNLLSAIGVWQRIEGHAQAMRRIELTDAALESPLRQVLLSYSNTVGDDVPASWVIENRYLLAALTDAVLGDEGIEVIAPARTVDWDATGPVGRLTLSLGADGDDGRSDLGCGLLAVAEGRGSSLRQAAGIKTVGWRYSQAGIVTTIRMAEPHNGVAVQHFLPGGPFAVLPLPDDRASLVWSERREVAEEIMAFDDDGFLAELHQRLGSRFGQVALDGPRGTWPLEMHLSRSMIAERLALVGDAAHGVHPLAGQGYNLAARDVAALAEVVGETVRLGMPAGAHDALSRYQQWRRFDATVSAFTFDALNQLFSNDRAGLRMVRDFGLAVVDRLPMLKRRLVAEAAGLNGDVPRLLRPAANTEPACGLEDAGASLT